MKLEKNKRLSRKQKLVFSLAAVLLISAGAGVTLSAILIKQSREMETGISETEPETKSEEVLPEAISKEMIFTSSEERLPEPVISEESETLAPDTTTQTRNVGASALGNCTARYGTLMLINPVFTVSTEYIAARRSELVDMTATYGINELHSYNGRPLLDAEAGVHLNEMLTAYSNENPGHAINTVSCFRSVGTACGRLCYATGTSDHHTGYTCDLMDPSYGGELNTDDYDTHLEWQWLHANSYKYGFIDRFIYEFAGGPMSEPINITEDGTTGLYETWHYRYVGIPAATEIATGKYNQGAYDSLEHYLKATGRVTSLTAGRCD